MLEQQSFIVTARKWRPQRFSDVIGQSHVTTTLKNAIAGGRIHHAYLFTGPRGVGKTTCARILARALNCTSPVDSEPCNKCDNCVQVLEGRNIDVIEIDGASNNSVDDVRKLRDNAKYAPLSGKYKLYIIDEVHMLSGAAFNALLKTLEEPPAHLVFVFATTEIHKVPSTILSRCQRFDFRRMEVSAIVNHLRHIANAENVQTDEGSFVAIARKADGSMRDAQSIFDQVVSFCGANFRVHEVADVLHIIDDEFFFDVASAIKLHHVAHMFEISQQVVSRGYDLQECLLGLLEHYRNLLTVVTTGNTDLIDASGQVRELYQKEAAEIQKADILRIMSVIAQGEGILRQNPPNPRVRFEFVLVQLAAMDETVHLSDLLSRISGSPTQSPVGGVAMAIKVGPGSPPLKTKSRTASALSARNLADKWHHVVEELPDHLAFVRSFVKQGALTIDFSDIGLVFRPNADVIHHRVADQLSDLKSYLKQVYGIPVGLQLIPAPLPDNGINAAARGNGEIPDDTSLTPLEKTLIDLFKAKRIRRA